MRISRKKRPEKLLIPYFKKNHEITATEVLLLGDEGENLGIKSLQEALRMAEEQEKDLVEINPKISPPVAKLIDFAEFKYQKEKEARKQKAHSHASEIKGVRLSIRIGEHDFDNKRDQSEKFLDRGDKVKVELMLRGRENAHPEMAREIIEKFIASISAHMAIRLEQEITKQGNKITAIIAKK